MNKPTLTIIFILCSFKYSLAQNTSPGINLNGFYCGFKEMLSNQKPLFQFMFFYGDGKYCSLFPWYSNIDTIPDAADILRNKALIEKDIKVSKKLFVWGFYKTESNTVTVRYYIHPGGNFGWKRPVDMRIKIKDSNTILLLKDSCSWCKGMPGYYDNTVINYNPPEEFKFIPFSVKPDSTLMRVRKSIYPSWRKQKSRSTEK